MDNARTFAVYGLLGALCAGSFAVIVMQIGSPDPPWTVITGVVTLLVRELGSLSTTGQILKAQAAGPTVAVTPTSAIVTPGNGA